MKTTFSDPKIRTQTEMSVQGSTVESSRGVLRVQLVQFNPKKAMSLLLEAQVIGRSKAVYLWDNRRVTDDRDIQTVCKLYAQGDKLIHKFRMCSPNVKCSLFRAFCTHRSSLVEIWKKQFTLTHFGRCFYSVT